RNVEYPVSLPAAKEEVRNVIDQSLRLIRTATTEVISQPIAAKTSGHIANTAFILMWMDTNYRLDSKSDCSIRVSVCGSHRRETKRILRGWIRPCSKEATNSLP